MTSSRALIRLSALVLLGILLALAACGPGGTASPGGDTANQATPTPTDTPTATPTPASPVCGTNFPNPPVYYNTLPDATFKATTVFAQVPLPPQTREFDNDAAGGVRGRQMCSAGTTDSVLSFMTQHLVQLGWQQIDSTGAGCLSAANQYGHPQCWKNGNYALFLGVNSTTDWIILFRDPDFM